MVSRTIAIAKLASTGSLSSVVPIRLALAEVEDRGPGGGLICCSGG